MHVLADRNNGCPYAAVLRPSGCVMRPYYVEYVGSLDMHHLTCGISSLLHFVNLIVFTLNLVHLILHISPHHHLSLPQPYILDVKLISFTNSFLHSHSYSFRTDFTDLNLYCIKGALALFVLVSFSGYVC